MDKYQEYMIKYLSFGFTTKKLAYFSKFEKNQVCLDENKEKLLVKQGTDPTIEKFVWMIGWAKDSAVQTIEYFIDNTWKPAETVEVDNRTFFVLNADFKKRIEKLKFCIKSAMTEDIIFPVEFVEISDADKKNYYDKVASEQRDIYISAASISHSTGTDLVNIYFQPCCADCGKTEIELYIAKGKYESPGRTTYVAYTPHLIGGEVQQLIGKFTVDEGNLFKSIGGLANGVYAYQLRQYNKFGNVLFESGFKFFKI